MYWWEVEFGLINTSLFAFLIQLYTAIACSNSTGCFQIYSRVYFQFLEKTYAPYHNNILLLYCILVHHDYIHQTCIAVWVYFMYASQTHHYWHEMSENCVIHIWKVCLKLIWLLSDLLNIWMQYEAHLSKVLNISEKISLFSQINIAFTCLCMYIPHDIQTRLW